MKHGLDREAGISTVGILVGLLVVVTLSLGGLSIWSYANYRSQKDNVTRMVNAAVQTAQKQQQATDDAAHAQQDKLPNATFTGPSDYGSVSFKYPKTWSVYLGNGNGGDGQTFTAYLNPGSVPTVSSSQQFALRVTIESQSYENVLASYASAVKRGTLRSSLVTTNGLTGTRLDGKFSTTLEGSLLIFKVRDKTLLVETDSPSFENDFNSTIVPSLTFTP